MEDEQNAYDDKRKYLEKYSYMKDYVMADSKVSKQNNYNYELEYDQNMLLKQLSNSQQEKPAQNISVAKEKIILNLKSGQNVMCNGYGSFINLFEDIFQNHFDDVPVLEIKGYQQSISHKLILQNLAFMISQFVNIEVSKSRADNLFLYIQENINKIKYDYILLVIHSLDGKCLRSVEIQEHLSLLALFKKIRVLSSVYHIRYNLLLTPKAAENFNFNYLNINTESSYIEEIKHLSVVGQNKVDKGVQALKYIMRSFTKNQKEIVKLLAKWQLENPKSSIDLNTLWEMSCEGMILTTQQSLKECLLEILDHKVFVQDDLKQYKMEYSRKTLEKIVNDQLEQDEEDEFSGTNDDRQQL